jgi:transposase
LTSGALNNCSVSVIQVPKTYEEALVVIEQLLSKIVDLENRLEKSEARAEKAEARVAELEKRLEKYEKKPSPDPTTPSGMIPPYQKPNRKKGRKKKAGRKKGHSGTRRKKPDHVDNHAYHPLTCCPDCGSTDVKVHETVTRYTEEIPPVKPIVTEHTSERGWCKPCHKMVTAKVDDALPRCTLGIRTVLLTAWMHFALGVSAHKVVRWLNSMCQMKISTGGLTQAWARTAEWLAPLHEQVWQEVRQSGVLSADETSWRVMGKTGWLWCFAAKEAVLYVIDSTRASPVVLRILGEAFNGVLVTDFYAAYNKVAAWAKQKCVVHLLRELEKVSVSNTSPEWVSFQRKLRRLLRDALRLGRDRDRYDDETYQRRWERLYNRLFELYSAPYTDGDAARIAARLERHRCELFTFLEFDGVPADNNYGEREIRPAVQMRKAYGGNRSERGAKTQAVWMSVFRTLEKRHADPIDYLEHYLRHMVTTNEALPLAS